MLKYFPLFILFVFLQSCKIGVVPLKGSYREEPIVKEISAPFGEVWQSILDFTVGKNLTIQTIDKSSGLIMADIKSFAGRMSQEDDKGSLIKPDADLAVERTKGDFPGPEIRYDAKAKWDVRVKEITESSSQVTVSVNSVQVFGTVTPLKGKTTGNFEQLLINFIINDTSKR